MHYGVIKQISGSYTEHQLRAYPMPSQRTQDGATAIPAKRVGAVLRRRLRTPHVASLHAGGVVVTIITAAESAALGVS